MPAPPETITAGARWNRARSSAYTPLYGPLSAWPAAGSSSYLALLAREPLHIDNLVVAMLNQAGGGASLHVGRTLTVRSPG